MAAAGDTRWLRAEHISAVRGCLATDTGDPDLPHAPPLLTLGETCAPATECLPVLTFSHSDTLRDVDAFRHTLADNVAEFRASHGRAPHCVYVEGLGALTAASPPDPGKGPLHNKIALVTGAAGAIGMGIVRRLLEEGCRVAAADLPGDGLTALPDAFDATHRGRLLSVAMDVTDETAVAGGMAQITEHWGGLDIAIVNAGIAHVAALTELDTDAFHRLQRVNTDGTLFTINAAARLMQAQGIGGDIVLVSSKNVFAPGARFGAYSATKAAAHQLARIASIELAEYGIRVNMVSPDAVFSEGGTPSGLWATVGPDRMRARGLSAGELEEYYRQRNLLKARVTARHVANAVLFFVTHQTPTTGATIPVDGGLPDASPR